MHIKQITISNFRSFKRQLELQEPFSPTTNIVIGSNGHGKSNLFAAVQFVLLSPRFYTLGARERRALLHEGTGSAAVNAFVEIVFDNSDNRFALEHSDEVVLRRTIGSKKDEFFLQRKRATKQEIASLLEGAGFSKSNPYFMVEQGKIQDLCTMTDAERLNLLQQVAGTTVYDEKKKESQIKMKENEQSIEKMDEILSDIDKRLQELQGETEELRTYQQLDRQRKSLEYTLYEKELRKARHALLQLETQREEHAGQYQAMHEDHRRTQDQIQDAESTLRTQAQNLRRNRLQLGRLEQDKKDAVKHREQCKWDMEEYRERAKVGAEELVKSKAQLKELNGQIAKAEADQEELLPRFRDERSKLDGLLREIEQVQHQMDAMYAKQGRVKQYSTIEERDAVLRQQMSEIEGLKANTAQMVDEQRTALANVRRAIQSQPAQVQMRQAQIKDRQDQLHSLGKQLNDKKKEHGGLFERRKTLWHDLENVKEQMSDAKEQLNSARGDFWKTMPRNTAMGISNLDQLVRREGLTVGVQYFGMLMDNFELKDDEYRTAVEVAAQNALFHVIVDTDETAARLMRRLEEHKLGRVTFLPLNRLHTDTRGTTQYPPEENCRILHACITFDNRVERAMRHVFDKKLLARTSEVASEWSSRYRMDAITIEGDLCSRKGALTGGYVDANKSRLRAHDRLRQERNAHDGLLRRFHSLKQDSEKVDHDVARTAAEVSQVEREQLKLERELASMQSLLDRAQSQMNENEREAERLETEIIPPLERDMVSFEGDLERLRKEIGTELVRALSDEERTTLQRLKQEFAAKTKAAESQRGVVDDITARRQQLSSLLQDNLLKARRELTETRVESGNGPGDRIERIASDAAQEQLEFDLQLREGRYDDAVKHADELESQMKQIRQTGRDIQANLDATHQTVEDLKTAEMDVAKRIEEKSTEAEDLLNKKSMNVSKRDTYVRKIQELGSLPPTSELKEHKKQSIPNLTKAIEGVNKNLKKYSHVNKKAFDQYVNFNDKRSELLRRKRELDEGATKVEELISSLDDKKDAAINRIFRKVSKNFRQVFKELVPLGGGKLIIKAAAMDDDDDDDNDEDDDDDEDETDKEAQSDVSEEGAVAKPPAGSRNIPADSYRGIGIKVWFSDSGENFMMSQLSGGQKALVALALIFAIQRCDPAPFYIFDELDQALDSTYRQAVANLIHRQSVDEDNPAQFIMSTFRPELVAVSDNFYRIAFRNRESRVESTNKPAALKFIADEEKKLSSGGSAAAEAVGRGSARDSRKRKSVAVE